MEWEEETTQGMIEAEYLNNVELEGFFLFFFLSDSSGQEHPQPPLF